MCGRYTLKRRDRIAIYGRDVLSVDLPSFTNRYNVAPSQLLPVACLDENTHAIGKTMRWGLIPFWDKAEKPKIAPINAKSEDVSKKRIFSQSLQKRRCLVPADGLFEWKKLTGDLKAPYHIQLKNGDPFFFAGIYERGNETRPDTFAILTTAANELMREIHDRMPVILRDDTALAWLKSGPITEDELGRLSTPYPAELMEAFPVHKMVGNPRNDAPECVIPWKPEPDVQPGLDLNSA